MKNSNQYQKEEKKNFDIKFTIFEEILIRSTFQNEIKRELKTEMEIYGPNQITSYSRHALASAYEKIMKIVNQD